VSRLEDEGLPQVLGALPDPCGALNSDIRALGSTRTRVPRTGSRPGTSCYGVITNCFSFTTFGDLYLVGDGADTDDARLRDVDRSDS
jgi:hypothetical protein